MSSTPYGCCALAASSCWTTCSGTTRSPTPRPATSRPPCCATSGSRCVTTTACSRRSCRSATASWPRSSARPCRADDPAARGLGSVGGELALEVVAVDRLVEDVGALEPAPLAHPPGLEGQPVEEHELGHRGADHVVPQLLADSRVGALEGPSHGQSISSV